MTVVSICTGPRPLEDRFYLNRLTAYWADAGIHIVSGPRFEATADLGILHINLTRIDIKALSDAPRGRPVINGRVLDISKSTFSVLRVERNSDWDGQVIVKTHANYFGKHEKWGRSPTIAERNRASMANISWRSARTLPENTYPVMRSVRLVPAWVWDDPQYVVERFMPERQGNRV
jgi:hypothetical protein